MAFPFAAAALVSAGTSLAGDALGYYSQQRANQSNEWNVAQSNEMNYRMFQEANDVPALTKAAAAKGKAIITIN